MPTHVEGLPCYELFFAPLEFDLTPGEFEQVQFAYMLSKFGHKEQTRDDGSRYFDHPKAAAWIYIDELKGRDSRIIVDLLLHDVPEDTYLLSWYRTALNFGRDIAQDLRGLTKLPKGKESVEVYLGRVIACGPHAIVSKLIDRLHNVRSLGGTTANKREKQIVETRTYHMPTLIPALRICGSPWVCVADSLEELFVKALSHYK